MPDSPEIVAPPRRNSTNEQIEDIVRKFVVCANEFVAALLFLPSEQAREQVESRNVSNILPSNE